MELKVKDFSEVALNIIESLRLADGLKKEEVDKLYLLFDFICKVYKGKECVPKEIVYAIIVLRDNVQGALQYYSGRDSDAITTLSSKIDLYMEDLLA